MLVFVADLTITEIDSLCGCLSKHQLQSACLTLLYLYLSFPSHFHFDSSYFSFPLLLKV